MKSYFNIGKHNDFKKKQKERTFPNVSYENKFEIWLFGWGMGGTSIAVDCADIPMSSADPTRPYTALLINSNEIDLDKLPNLPNAKKLLLKGYGRGGGRDIVLGQKAFEDNKEMITQEVVSYFKDAIISLFLVDLVEELEQERLLKLYAYYMLQVLLDGLDCY